MSYGTGSPPNRHYSKTELDLNNVYYKGNYCMEQFLLYFNRRSFQKLENGSKPQAVV